MTSEPESMATREARLDEVVARYLQAVERGEPVDRQAWLARHPEFATELAQFFADCDAVERVAVPDRKVVAAATAADPNSTLSLTPGNGAIGRGTHVRYFGDYEVLAEIARGGMGVVFKARQVSLNRLVAVKMILSGHLASKTELQRFHTEAEAAAGLDHPSIVPIHEVGEYQGQCYLSMKLVEGGSLAQHLPRYQKDEKTAAGLVTTLARAIHFAHQRGIIHRDLKPANILFDADGEPLISDFGLAKRLADDSSMTHTGAVLGTPSYMAPEQAEGKKGAITTAADVYSLGAILYELLTGRPPFRAETAYETVRLVVEAEVVPPSQVNPRVSRDLEAICLKCLQKDPQQRYSSAAALAEDLDHWLAGEPTIARPPSMAQLVWIWLRKNVRATLWTVLVGLVCGGVGSALCSLIAIGTLLANMEKTYALYPSLTPPWLAHDWLGRNHPLPPAVYVVSALAGGLAWAGMGILILAQLKWERRWRNLALCGAIGVLPALIDWKIGSPFLALGAALGIGGGLFTALLVGTRSTWGDLNAGIAVGLVAGVASFTFGVGQAVVIATMVVNSLNDLQLVGLAAGREEPGAESIKVAAAVAAGASALVTSDGHPLALLAPVYATHNYLPIGLTGAHPSDFLVTGYKGLRKHSLKGYEDLAKIEPGFRGFVFFPKIVSDQVAGAFTGIWIGMSICLLLGVTTGTFQTLTAGYLLRHRQRVVTILFPYLEVTITGFFALVNFWVVVVSLLTAGLMGEIGWQDPLLFSVLAALAVVALLNAWPWQLRLLVFIAWLVAYRRLAAPEAPQPPWWVDIVVYPLTLVLIAYYFERNRRRFPEQATQS